MEYEFNGLDTDQLGGSLFENEMVSEARGGKHKKGKGGHSGHGGHGKNKRGGRGMRKRGQVPAGCPSPQTPVMNTPTPQSAPPMEATPAPIPQAMQQPVDAAPTPPPASGFDGDSQSYFDGKAALKSINWKMVGVGVVLAIFAIVAVKKLKLIK